MRIPKGFTFSGVAAGIRPSRKDLALVVSDSPCNAGGIFTINRARAAPVADADARLPDGGIRAVIVNSGNANALTGSAGAEAVACILEAVGKQLGVPAASVLSASTGVIGVKLPVHKVLEALPALVNGLSPVPDAASEAILTTDTRRKLAWRTVSLPAADGSSREVTIAALCKGSGMIAPALATMIAVVVTDAELSPELCEVALQRAAERSFNSLTVDNDMSTNDAAFLLANGRAGAAPLLEGSEPFERFVAALTELSVELAREIAADGEGATKLLEVQLRGAPDDAVARDLAKSIASSALVKAAIFGADPNWGRILATVGARVGSLGLPIEPQRASVVIQGVAVYRGEPVAFEAPALRQKLRAPEVKVEVDLAGGPGSAQAWGCDLSYDYVKINADYTSLIVQTPTGGVAKDDRLTNYSPTFKKSLLVEALSYISRFAGKRCVIKCGGAATVKEALKASFCDDVNLLRSVGLLPIVVHGGGPEISHTLEKLGRKPEMVDGMQVTDASDLKVVEMVLSGAVNTELVTLLNRSGGHAVGVSGKDGALIRAKKLRGESGRDLGQLGEVTSIDRSFLDMLLQRGYVPVISPIGIGDDGQSYHIGADWVAAAVAAAVSAEKLIFLADAPGILDGGDLVQELTRDELAARLEKGVISGGMTSKARAALRALDTGVRQVHVIDGRTPHSVIAELFTDHGVGTLVTATERSS